VKNAKVSEIEELGPTSDELLEVLFQDRSRIAKVISSAFMHELHTPAVIIRGLAELILRKSEKIDPAQLRELSREAEQLLRSLEMLGASIINDDGSAVQNISLKEVVKQSTLFFEKSCLEKGISIRVDVADTLRVESSADRLKSILMTLLENAVDAFEFKSARDLKSISIQAQKSFHEIHLIISDTGEGMSLDQQNIFSNDIFKKRKWFEKKSLIGLSLAQKLARELNITISVLSEKSRGNCFTLVFPQ
jgi:signal transduction histidine kinase